MSTHSTRATDIQSKSSTLEIMTEEIKEGGAENEPTVVPQKVSIEAEKEKAEENKEMEAQQTEGASVEGHTGVKGKTGDDVMTEGAPLKTYITARPRIGW